jgi:hypothetical protein
MKGTVSFHPTDTKFFERIVDPLVAGDKVNPETYLDTALRVRATAWETLGYKLALETRLELLTPPPSPEEATMWQKVRARLEKFDYKPDPLALKVAEKVEPELHLHGRPFLITEGSADRVAMLIDEYLHASGPPAVKSLVLEQLVRLDAELGGLIEPEEIEPLSSEMVFRRELLAALKTLFDLPQAARQDDHWGAAGGDRLPARELLPRQLPWLAVDLHARCVPFWTARDVDGLETVCRSAEIEPPDCLTPAWRLFPRACEEFPQLREELGFELRGERSVGAMVSPDRIADLIAFLSAQGSKIIQAATRHGVGKTASTLLRKIRECARYAERHGMGYLEAAGVRPMHEVDPFDGQPGE